jgi:penicillin-binding protein 1A
MANYIIKVARRAGIVLLFVLAAVLGITSGVLFAYAGDLPEISALDDYSLSTISRVYDARGGVVGEFAIERREVVTADQISPRLKQAILAAEDASFEQHFGLSIPHIVITLIKDIIAWEKVGGASTLTQQLARKLFLTDEKTWERKIKEAILAIQIEKRYTKTEIFTLYCNKMYFGHGVYGVEAAAKLYFGKSARDLALEEAALIAGILQGNVRQSPYVNMNAAIRRRNYALTRMADVGYITPEEAEAARNKPIVVRDDPPPSQNTSAAPYFLEEVRKELESRYGAKKLYENGLAVQTALDLSLQRAATEALERGLRTIDKRRGFRKPQRNIVKEGHAIESFRQPRWERTMRQGDVVPAIVTGIEGAGIQLRAGALRVKIDRKGYAWTNRRAPGQLVREGDLVETRLLTIADTGDATGTLEQAPAVEGAVLAIDNRTGQIKAMVGGYSFERSKFNRAVQAYRQVGSAFKPIVYTAAIDRGYTPVSLLMDTPASFQTGPNQPPYSPLNYDRQFEGPVTLRHALEQSRNVPAVRVMEQLGPAQVVAYARRLGLEGTIPPFLAVALGAAEATLRDMTSAYSSYPNQGVRMQPYSVLKVTDREGNVLEENRPEPKDAIRADTAYVMTHLLRGVVQRGTGARAASLNWPIGGKTGTTDDYTDAWFIGFDPDITLGVWVGYDLKRSMGPAGTGSDSALPIWIEIMKAWIGDRKEAPSFDAPGNIVFAAIDRHTGDAAVEGIPGAITEAFIAGTQPGMGFRQ